MADQKWSFLHKKWRICAKGQNYRIVKVLDIFFWISENLDNFFFTWTCLLADASSKIPVRHEVNSSMIVSSDRNRNHANRWFRVSFVKSFWNLYWISFISIYLPFSFLRCPFFPFSFPSSDVISFICFSSLDFSFLILTDFPFP